MKNRLLKIFLLVLLVLSASRVQTFALSFKDQLRPVKLIKYKHWHLQKKKITGYTKIEIKTTSKAGEKYFLEVSQNLDKDQKIFSEKKTWFNYQTGELASYSEVDFRTGISITDRVEKAKIVTQVRNKDDLLELSIQREQQLIPFETLALFLQKRLPELQEKRELTFTLYLPVIAIELKKKNFPLSFSKFEMAARVVEESKKETPLGLKTSMRIVLNSTSFLINTMLPKEKTAFHFTFMTEPPYLLLEFEENQTRSILVTYDP